MDDVHRVVITRRAFVVGALALVAVGAAGGAAGAEWLSAREGVARPSVVATSTPASPSPAAAGPVTPRTDEPAEARALSKAFSSTARALRPSVVRIDVERTREAPAERRRLPDGLPRLFEDFFRFEFDEARPPAPREGGTGSGVIIDSQGHIVTNRHVVLGGSKVTVTLADGKEIEAKVVGKDERTDVAVIKLEKVPANLVAARLGDSNRLEVGEWVIAVGSPLGIEQTVTAGIVSGTGRAGRINGADRVSGWIQTDAKINPGNSGGPLVNLDGEVVGINTWINVGPGGAYGYAVPINDVKRVSEALIKDGRMRYPYLGVMVFDVGKPPPEKKDDLPKDLPTEGAYVDQVTPGGPADRAGLREGDVITRIDDQPIRNASHVVAYVSSRRIGDPVTISYLRGGKPNSVTASLGELPSSDQSEAVATGKVGLQLQTLTPDVANALGVSPSTKGAVIAEVVPGSLAERAGLRAGEVIVEVDRRPVASADDVVSSLRKGGGHLLRVRGPQGTRFVAIKVE